jgi:hypothetical protein
MESSTRANAALADHCEKTAGNPGLIPCEPQPIDRNRRCFAVQPSGSTPRLAEKLFKD